ncbi:hypothetical protein ACJIZ3_008601 [Penstemon smallii]|uniref:Ubiquitin-like domain-containing protein n=1 Tax=Penstemon smallii TaxID=265156 RepID=A0ABD3TAY8_9LAMI
MEKSSFSSSNSTLTTESSHRSVNTHVKIRVHNGEDDRVFCFQIQRDVRLLKLMKKYGERVGVDYNTLRFSYDGRRIKEDQTAEGLELEDDAEINAFSEQGGGGTNHTCPASTLISM